MSTTLADYRRQIDALDDRLIALLAERFHIIRAVAALKAREGLPAVIPARIDEVLNRCAAQAETAGLSPAFVRALYQAIIAEACRVEEELI